MECKRTVERFVPRWGIHFEPCAHKVECHLILAGLNHDLWFIKSPWACVDAPSGGATTDEQMAAVLGSSRFMTEQEALDYATARAPHWHCNNNQIVLSRLHDAIRWHGDFSGPYGLADAMEMGREHVYEIACGERKATRKQADLAKAYHGRPV